LKAPTKYTWLTEASIEFRQLTEVEDLGVVDYDAIEQFTGKGYAALRSVFP
jgi:hypothetical protein